jgi:hypothetical protein
MAMQMSRKKNSATRIAALATALIAFGTAQVSLAQSQTGYDDDQVLLSQIQADKTAVVLKAMQLDDAQVAKFSPIYDAYLAERKQLAQKGIDLINSYASNYDSMTDDAAQTLMKDWFKLQDADNDLLKEYAKKLTKVLPETKVLRFVQIENKLNSLLKLTTVRAIPLVK